MRKRWIALIGLVVCLAIAGAAWAAMTPKLVGGTYDFGEGTCFDEDSTAPTTAAHGFALHTDKHRGPANRVALLVDLATRTSWGIVVHCYSYTTATWYQLEPATLQSVSVTVTAKDIIATITADTVIAWELGGHCGRMAVEHSAVGGGTKGASACLVGN